MEVSNPTPYFFVKELFLNIIIALRRPYSNFLCVFVFVVFCCCILSIFVPCFFILPYDTWTICSISSTFTLMKWYTEYIPLNDYMEGLGSATIK